MNERLTSPPVSCRLRIQGGRPLSGEVKPSGFKHSLVTTVAAAMATGARLELNNCPDITETHILASLIEHAGGSAKFDCGRMTIDPEHLWTGRLDEELSGLIHGSPYLAPALLRRFGEARICAQGGCQIGGGAFGRRPIEHYAEVLQRFGALAQINGGGTLVCSVRHISGCDIDMRDYAVDRFGPLGNLYSGATKMALLTAAVAQGVSIVRHPYMKADVLDLIQVLRSAGVTIESRGNNDLVVSGIQQHYATTVRHTLLPDLIEVVSWITAACIAADEPLTMRGAGMRRVWKELRYELEIVDRMGIRLDVDDTAITVHPTRPLRCIQVEVRHDASIFSDSQPFIGLLSTFAVGNSRIADYVWPDRFAYAAELNRLGTDIAVRGNSATISGMRPPCEGGRTVHGTDLRSTAVLVLAALCVAGDTVLTGAEHLDRGYADFPGALRKLGATIDVYGGAEFL